MEWDFSVEVLPPGCGLNPEATRFPWETSAAKSLGPGRGGWPAPNRHSPVTRQRKQSLAESTKHAEGRPPRRSQPSNNHPPLRLAPNHRQRSNRTIRSTLRAHGDKLLLIQSQKVELGDHPADQGPPRVSGFLLYSSDRRSSAATYYSCGNRKMHRQPNMP